MRARNYYRKRRSPWPRRFLMLALVCVMAYAAWQLIDYGLQAKQARDMQQELRMELATEMPASLPQDSLQGQTVSADAAGNAGPQWTPVPTLSSVRTPAPTLEPWRTPEILPAYRRLRERNSDLVGWLTIERLYRVDIPIVQRDQTYYLRRDFDGKPNMNGTAFLDETCRIWPRDDNLIIYAHNMKSGEMFGELHRLADADYYRDAPVTWFNTIYEKGIYVPIAAVLCTVAQGPEYFGFFQRDFRNAEEFDAYIARARELSKLQTPFDARFGDQLLTLVTCYDDANTQRFVVILRRIRDTENVDAVVSQW